MPWELDSETERLLTRRVSALLGPARGRDGERPVLTQATLDICGERPDLGLQLVSSGPTDSRKVEIHREAVVAKVGLLESGAALEDQRRGECVPPIACRENVAERIVPLDQVDRHLQALRLVAQPATQRPMAISHGRFRRRRSR